MIKQIFNFIVNVPLFVKHISAIEKVNEILC